MSSPCPTKSKKIPLTSVSEPVGPNMMLYKVVMKRFERRRVVMVRRVEVG